MSIRRKIFIPMIMLTIAGSAAVLLISIFLYDRDLHNAAYQRINVAAMTVEYEIDALRKTSHSAATGMAKVSTLAEAISRKDHNEIVTIATDLQKISDVEFCTISDSEGNVLARTHEPDFYGDSVLAQFNVRAALSGEIVTVIEQGTAVPLSVRTGVPVYDENRNIVGVVSTGVRLDTFEIVSFFKKITGCDVTFFLGDERVATTIEMDDGSLAVGTKASESVSKIVLAGEKYIGEAQVLGKTALTEYAPLFGPDDEVIGMMFVGEYTADDEKKMFSFILSGALISLAVLAVCIVIATVVAKTVERRLANMTEKSHEAEERIKIMFDATPLSCRLWDADFNLLDCNQEAVKLFKLSSKQEYIKKYTKLSPEYQPCGRTSSEMTHELLARAFEEGYVRFEWMHQRLDGEPIPCEIILVRSEHKGEDLVLSYTRDLRREKEMLDKIQEEKAKSEARAHWYKSILNAVPMPISVTDSDMMITFINSTTEMAFGAKEADMRGKHCSIWNSEICNTERCGIACVKRGVKQTYFTHGGMYFRADVEILKDLEGETSGYVEIVQDITQIETMAKKQWEIEEEKKASDNLVNILNGLDVMVYVTDPKTSEILFMNDIMKLHYGIDGDCTGQLCYKVLQEGIEEQCEFCPCKQLDKEPDAVVVWEEHSTATKRYYHNTDRYIRWPDGRVAHIQCSLDITDMRLMTLQLAAAKELAEQNDRAKSIFLASMSHEIRTPMNAILGMAEIQMQNQKLPEDTVEAINIIYDSGNLLLNIINDILDFSKIEAGKMEIIPIKYDIPSLINDTVQLTLLRYESKQVYFLLDLDENTPLELFGDELRIKQILNNILSNAFKYTDKGMVSMSISAEQSTETSDITLVIRVSDTGQGMTEEQLSRLFEEYARFNMQTNRTTVGTGLGMSITKRLLDMMNGEIFVKSEPDKGSTFTIRLPQGRVGSDICGAERAEQLQKLRFQSTTKMNKAQILREYMPYGKALIVDDVNSNLYVAKGMLLPYGLNIEIAGSGFEAVKKIESGKEYDIVFMDYMMPGMDGIEAVKIIRDMGYARPIVALTANVIIGQAEKFMSNGFDGFLSKPIDSRELNAVLNKMIRDKYPREVVEAARREKSNGGMVTESLRLEHDISAAFVQDAENVIAILEETLEKQNIIDAEDIESYITTVHGMKSALANVGETELADVARQLEQAGYDGDMSFISSETPAFLNSLKAMIIKL